MNNLLQNAILNGLYDKNYPGYKLFQPKLLTNTKTEKIWFTLREELLGCKSFTWAVAFITQDMLTPFKVVMADLAERGIKGTIITGDYLNFNNPVVFNELMKIPNLQVRIAQNEGFHTKGYLFEHDTYQTLVIGSANFTRSALINNYEWSLKLNTNNNAALTTELITEIQNLKNKSSLLTSVWLKNYQQSWVPRAINEKTTTKTKVVPNRMQSAALKELNKLVQEKKTRGLIVSATGTGKTYLGAFAVKQYQPKRFLYIVHREQIAVKALESFYKVIGGKRSDYGLLTGNKHELVAKYIFATVQTVSQKRMLAKFEPNEFEYILIDEAHRAAAPSYQTVLQYFKPKFWLGMTATPERMDEKDVYKIFDYNLAYEIRLKDALEAKMLAPFHYVGVQDYEQDNEIIDETTNLRYLIAKKRVKYVLQQIEYYGYCGTQACGLVFCSRQEEAKKLAQQFTTLGHPAQALTNQDDEQKRNDTITKLQQGKLEYIVTVDLFNEGVDIPSLNQIIMLRNTQSSTIFIQQLGRGLRKYPGKKYVTVIDFIGNYRNNYLIPIALNYDVNCDKDRLLHEIKAPQLIDVSTINFSQVASKRIITSLQKIKLDSFIQLKVAYHDLKNKLGHQPYLFDFYHYGSVSPEVFAKNKNFDNYGSFLQKMGESVELSTYENEVLSFLTKELLNGKRPHELLLLSLLLIQKEVSTNEYIATLKQNKVYFNSEVLRSVQNILSLDFFNVKIGKTTQKKRYGNRPLIIKTVKQYKLNAEIANSLSVNDKFLYLFKDIIKTGLAINCKYDNSKQFTLYQKYNRKDVCRLLNWPLDVSAPMYGYRVGKNITPIFITYKKNSRQKRNADYQNTLKDAQSLQWYTRSPRHINSKEVQKLLGKDMKLQVFVKRDDAAGKDFYYLGVATILRESVTEEEIGEKKRAVVGMKLLLQNPLTQQMFDILFED